MNKRILTIVGLFYIIGFSLDGFSQVKIGNNPTTLDAGAILEMETTNRALYMARVNLTSTTSAEMGPSGNTRTAKAGMVVYNTNASISGDGTYPASGAGIYTFDGTGWVYGAIPKGGANGQVLSRTSTGLQWTNMSSGVSTYSIETTSNPNPSDGNAVIITATGSGVTYDINPTTNTLTITVPAGIRLLSAKILETQARFGNADEIFFVIKTASGDGLNTSFTNATIPTVQFYNNSASPAPIVSRAVRMVSATNNEMKISVTQMTSYSQYLFLLTF